MELTDAKLIERLKQGDERAYSELYDQHYVFLCYVANSYVKDHFTAETIVGDMIFHLWEIRETLVISTSLRSYLSRAIRNRCINYLLSKNSVPYCSRVMAILMSSATIACRSMSTPTSSV